MHLPDFGPFHNKTYFSTVSRGAVVRIIRRAHHGLSGSRIVTIYYCTVVAVYIPQEGEDRTTNTIILPAMIRVRNIFLPNSAG